MRRRGPPTHTAPQPHQSIELTCPHTLCAAALCCEAGPSNNSTPTAPAHPPSPLPPYCTRETPNGLGTTHLAACRSTYGIHACRSSGSMPARSTAHVWSAATRLPSRSPRRPLQKRVPSGRVPQAATPEGAPAARKANRRFTRMRRPHAQHSMCPSSQPQLLQTYAAHACKIACTTYNDWDSRGTKRSHAPRLRHPAHPRLSWHASMDRPALQPRTGLLSASCYCTQPDSAQRMRHMHGTHISPECDPDPPSPSFQSAGI